MTKAKANRIYEIITEVFDANNEVSWELLVKSIKSHTKITNWLEVRNVLQYAIENDGVRRTRKLKDETYIRLVQIVNLELI